MGLIEDRGHRPNANRIAFWAETKEDVDRIVRVVEKAGGQNIEGPMFCPEYSSTYYGLFFEDPSGNRLGVCCRTVNFAGDSIVGKASRRAAEARRGRPQQKVGWKEPHAKKREDISRRDPEPLRFLGKDSFAEKAQLLSIALQRE